MDNQALLIGITIFGFITIIFILVFKKTKSTSDQALLEWIKSLQTSIEQTNKTLYDSMQSTNKNITSTLQSNTQSLNERLDRAAHVISQVQKNIGEMSEIGRGMRELQEFLKSPKLRGNIGEQILKDLLSQMLPKNSFHIQYAFSNGTIVDACIKTSAGMIPVDSKFPIENFRKYSESHDEKAKKQFQKDFAQDVKHHIDSISKKYILPDEGTIDYALMYVPSESVYYEVVNTPTLYDYSSQKRVLLVSPTTFYAFLKAILMSFEGQRMNEKVHEILTAIHAIQKEYEKVDENLDTLTKHIQNSYNMVSQVQSGYTKLGQKIKLTTHLEEQSKIEEKDNPLLNKPN